MHSKQEALEKRVFTPGAALTLALTLITLAFSLAGCAPGGTAQSPTAVAPPQGITPTANADPAQPTALVPGTVTIALTGAASVAATNTPLPTPTGTAPDPLSQLRILDFYDPTYSLVKRDYLDLDGAAPNEVLFTVSNNRLAITEEVDSRMGAMVYDQVYRNWSLTWVSEPISGTTHPLPAANRSASGGYNGGNILGTGSAIFAARTTTRDGRAHLYLWLWNPSTRSGEPLKMVDESGKEQDAVFTADLDLNLSDLDDDSVYEVVADDVAGVRVWRWDAGAKRFTPEVAP